MLELILCLFVFGCLLYWVLSRETSKSSRDAASVTEKSSKEIAPSNSQPQNHGAMLPHEAASFLGGIHPVSNRPYPVITTDMVTGVNGQLSYEDCRKVIRLYLKAIDFRSEHGRTGAVDSIHNWMVEHEDFPRKCANQLHEDVAVRRMHLNSLKESVKICRDKNRRKSMLEEMELERFEIAGALDQIDGIKEEIRQLKLDRLEYLVDNINRHVHGTHWRIVCNRPAWYAPKTAHEEIGKPL